MGYKIFVLINLLLNNCGSIAIASNCLLLLLYSLFLNSTYVRQHCLAAISSTIINICVGVGSLIFTSTLPTLLYIADLPG